MFDVIGKAICLVITFGCVLCLSRLLFGDLVPLIKKNGPLFLRGQPLDDKVFYIVMIYSYTTLLFGAVVMFGKVMG